MRYLFIVICLLSMSMRLQAQDKAVLREIAAAFGQIESEYKDWPHYSYRAENLEGGQSYERHVWKSDGDEGFIKVESLDFDDHGETKTQFFFKGAELLFTLDRTESSLMMPKAPTEVLEKRYYFADGQLIRVLEKKGKFPAGTSTNTEGLKNQELPLSELENASETYTTQHEIAAQVIERARLMDDDASDPAEVSAGGVTAAATGEGWRVIAGSGSRDGTYALAWGLKGQSNAEGEADDDGDISVDPADENLVNYVVNVRTQEIVGKIAGKHFGDKANFNHINTETAWSSGAGFVAQMNSGKWETSEAHVYEVQNGAAVSKGADLIKPVSKVVFEHLESGEKLKKFTKDDFAITLHDVRIVYQAGSSVLQVGVIGQVPKNEDEAASFESTLSFILTADESGGAPALRWSSTEGH